MIPLSDVRCWLLEQDSEELGDDPTSCWASAAYMRSLYGNPTEMCHLDPCTLPNGRHFLGASNMHEAHEFMLVRQGDEVTVYQTYGGLEMDSVQELHMPWSTFCTLTRSSLGADWRKLFSIPEWYPIPDTIGPSEWYCWRRLRGQSTAEEGAAQLTELLAKWRSDDAKQWIMTGQCLRNISPGLHDTWLKFSKRSDRYQEGDDKWHSFNKDTNGPGLATLHYWARTDNPEAYQAYLG